MGWTPWESLVAGAIVSISGAVIVAKAFEEVRVDSRVGLANSGRLRVA
jgi:NhaP-type Na+/H+ or K+/H+ antiporter